MNDQDGWVGTPPRPSLREGQYAHYRRIGAKWGAILRIPVLFFIGFAIGWYLH